MTHMASGIGYENRLSTQDADVTSPRIVALAVNPSLFFQSTDEVVPDPEVVETDPEVSMLVEPEPVDRFELRTLDTFRLTARGTPEIVSQIVDGLGCQRDQ